MKKLYSFTLNKKETVDQTEKSTNDKGEEISITKKVEKEIPYNYCVKKPSRIELEESEIYRASQESDLIRRGVITSTLLQKRILDDKGFLSEEQKKELESLETDFVTKQQKYAELNNIIESDRTPEQKTELEVLLKDLTDIMGQIQKFNDAGSNLYNRTAEALARNKTCLYLTLLLSYKEQDGKEVPIFAGKTYEDKLVSYDKIVENDEDNSFDYKLTQTLLLLVSAWYMGRVNTKEEFDLLLKMAEGGGILG